MICYMIYGYIHVSLDKQTGTMTKKASIECRQNRRRADDIRCNGRCLVAKDFRPEPGKRIEAGNTTVELALTDDGFTSLYLLFEE